MKTLRTMVVGTGFMGGVHLEALRRLGFVDGFAISGLVQGEFEEYLKDATLDAVEICTPNALHYPMARAALDAGKHVLCEKPLATSVADAKTLVDFARSKGLRNCTCHNLRCYPMVQQMRSMVEDGDVGEILIAQGTYSQDWLFYDTDWNWRVESKAGGPSRALADIGSHWCDLVEHVTGLRITEVCADLQTFHKKRRQPKVDTETFGGKMLRSAEFHETAVDTEDFASVQFHMGESARGAFTVSQVSAGCKNRLQVEIYGSKCSVVWNGERPDELWIGHRDAPNQILLKDPALLKAGAHPFADLPGGHSEGYDDTFKQLLRRFYRSIADPQSPVDYPEFADGLRQLRILEAELASHQRRGWQEVAR